MTIVSCHQLLLLCYLLCFADNAELRSTVLPYSNLTRRRHCNNFWNISSTTTHLRSRIALGVKAPSEWLAGDIRAGPVMATSMAMAFFLTHLHASTYEIKAMSTESITEDKARRPLIDHKAKRATGSCLEGWMKEKRSFGVFGCRSAGTKDVDKGQDIELDIEQWPLN
ncbi:hypothetical protein F5880DRAFT_40858 [Lentinula raphanica]|nr:hypothetical protein F5880DRAFT_40858 [Lentinula raphanica]